MKLNQFSGGLSTRLDASLIGQNEAIVYSNIDTDKGVLVNSLDYLDQNQEVRGFFYKFKNQWVSSYLERSYVEYNNQLLFSEAFSYPKKYDGTNYTRLGIVGPANKLNVSESAATTAYLAELDISSRGLAARDLHFSDDGYSLYTLDETNDAVDQWELGTAFDITTAEYANTVSIASKETNAMGLTFKPNGTRFYVVGNNRVVYEYSMSVAWDVSTATYTTSFSIAANNTTPQGIVFNDDGKRAYILDSTTGHVNEYSLVTGYLISGLTFVRALDASARDSALTGLFFKSDGKRLYLVGYTNDKVYEYTLETAWDLSTAVYYGELADISIETTTSTGLFFSPDLLRLYIVAEPSGSKIVQYDVKRISSADSTIQYVYTYYNSTDDVESVPSPVSDEFDIKAVRSATLTAFEPSTDAQVDKIRLYRIGDNATSFTLVTEFDNTTTTYVDSVPSTELTDILESSDYYAAQTGLKYLTEAYGILFGAIDNKLYFSVQRKPNAWPESYYIVFKKNITGILPSSDGILVFMQNATDLLIGTGVASFARRSLSLEQGCTNHFTARYVQNMPVWQSEEGICAYASGSVKVISKDKLGTQNFSIVNTAVLDETYFACLEGGSILAVSTKLDTLVFKNFSFSKLISNIYTTDGALYGIVDNDRLVKLLVGPAIAFSYKSPVFIDDSYTNIKTYNNIYVRADGDFEFSIFIDEVLVKTYTLTGNTTHDISVPQASQKGYGIQFEINGIGKIYEIEYKVMERQNGR